MPWSCSDRKLLALLYEDWLQADGDWSQSSIYYNSLEKNSKVRRGVWKMVEYKYVKEKYGDAIAAGILENKKKLQSSKRPEEPDWFTKHPEVDHEARHPVGQSACL